MNRKYFSQLEDEIAIEKDDFKDEELVWKSLENPKLFEFFVDKYRDSFLRTAGRVLKSGEEAEEVVQDAFVKIYFNARKFQKKKGIEFKSWAFKILMNCVFSRYRKLKRTFGDSEYLDELLYIEDRVSASDFSQKEKRDEIESVLLKMPEDLSDLMREHYLTDQPYAKISVSRNISIPALKMKLFRARKKFKEIMGNISS